MELLIIVVLALLNGVLAMAELAIVSARKSRLISEAESGSKSAQTVLELQEDPEVFLPTVQVGITLVGTISAAFGGSTLAAPVAAAISQVEALRPHANSLAFVGVVAGISYLNLVLGELVPKRLALRFPETMAKMVSPLLTLLARLCRPVVWLLGISTRLVLGLFRVGPTTEPTVTEEDFRHLLAESTRSGVFEGKEETLVHRVLSLDDWPVTRLMCPRADVVWLDLEADTQENLRRIAQTPHSKYPVCRGSLDQVEGVIGVQELLVGRTADGELWTDQVKARIHHPLVLPSSLNALVLLERFQTSGVHLGLVVDEYGTMRGIVTVNDILEAIVGDLPVQGVLDAPPVVEREDGSFLVEAGLPSDELFRLMGVPPLLDTSYHTIAGFVLERLGHIPEASETLEYEGWVVEVIDMDGHRIDKVLLRRPQHGGTG